MSRLIIGDPQSYYHTQVNNKLHPFVTCFPTSVANVIEYELQDKGMNQTEIGIPEDVQIEDFITANAKKQTLINWMMKTVGSWTKDYVQRAWTVGKVEEKLFDDLMNNIGFDSEFTDCITYKAICEHIESTQLPQVIFGNFVKVNKNIQGHVCCAVGYDTDKGIIICNDPYGDANNGYKETGNGAGVEYVWEDFFVRGTKKDGTKYGWMLAMSRK